MDFEQKLNIDDYRYILPEERIAWYPLPDRDMSKLLLMYQGKLSTCLFRDLPTLLPSGSLLLFNDTRVIRARMLFRKETGARIEIFFLNPVEPSHDHEVAFASGSPAVWECIIGNARRWKEGDLTLQFSCEGVSTTLRARLAEKGHSSSRVALSWEPATMPLASILEAAGHIPLPPYINREDEPDDNIRYQTVYARHDGSVAAPTAGLHFTPQMLATLAENGVEQAKITLHVGAGTFKPVTSKEISTHVMHKEEIIIRRELLEKLISHKSPVIPVGTTSVRSIESLYWYGVRVFQGKEALSARFTVQQWEPYHYGASERPDASTVFSHLLEQMREQNLNALHGTTSLIIVPGYRFAVTDGLITNFHQPASTLLLLVAALTGNNWKRAYEYALENGFRFLSYGDACLFLKTKAAP